MKLLWLDLNSSYAHSSLALPALHAQIADDTTIEWCTVSATINENTGMVVNQIYHHQPDIIAATNWLFNHEQLLHIVSRAKALLPHCCFDCDADPNGNSKRDSDCNSYSESGII